MAFFHIDGLIQERCNSIANALELHLYCTNPSICRVVIRSPFIKTRHSYNCLTFIIGILILLRHIYIETGPWFLFLDPILTPSPSDLLLWVTGSTDAGSHIASGEVPYLSYFTVVFHHCLHHSLMTTPMCCRVHWTPQGLHGSKYWMITVCWTYIPKIILHDCVTVWSVAMHFWLWFWKWYEQLYKRKNILVTVRLKTKVNVGRSIFLS